MIFLIFLGVALDHHFGRLSASGSRLNATSSPSRYTSDGATQFSLESMGGASTVPRVVKSVSKQSLLGKFINFITIILNTYGVT